MNTQGPRRALHLLLEELETFVDEILVAARAAGAAPQSWHQIVVRWTGAAPQHGIENSGAANGADVFETLRALEMACMRQLEQLDASLAEQQRDELEAAIDDARCRTVRDLCKRRTTAYNRSLSGGLSIGGVFAKAAARQQPSAGEPEGPARSMLFCKTCAAPRELDGLYGKCSFCGEPLFPGG